jgi:hypothetical protein
MSLSLAGNEDLNLGAAIKSPLSKTTFVVALQHENYWRADFAAEEEERVGRK